MPLAQSSHTERCAHQAVAATFSPLRMPDPRIIVAGESCQNRGGIVPRFRCSVWLTGFDQRPRVALLVIERSTAASWSIWTHRLGGLIFLILRDPRQPAFNHLNKKLSKTIQKTISPSRKTLERAFEEGEQTPAEVEGHMRELNRVGQMVLRPGEESASFRGAFDLAGALCTGSIP